MFDLPSGAFEGPRASGTRERHERFIHGLRCYGDGATLSRVNPVQSPVRIRPSPPSARAVRARPRTPDADILDTMADRESPTTVWGVLMVAARLLEASAGLARYDHYAKDHKAGKLTVYSALQDALWPPPEPVFRFDHGIPSSPPGGRTDKPYWDPRCALYWEAVRLLDRQCGGDGKSLDGIDKVCDAASVSVADVAARMRLAAQKHTAAPPSAQPSDQMPTPKVS